MKITTCPKHPKHKVKLLLELVRTGGCCGHGPEEYCYCDSPDIHAELYCRGVPGKGGQLTGCSHRVKVVPGLTDADAIERWIRERYEISGDGSATAG